MNSSLILPLLLVVLALPLFLSARKQRRAMNEMQQLQNSLEPGDRVMTTSGLQGTVLGTTDDTIDLEIAPGVHTTWIRAAVREKVKPAVEDTEYGDEDAVEAEEQHEAHEAVEDSATEERPAADVHDDTAEDKDKPKDKDKGASAH